MLVKGLSLNQEVTTAFFWIGKDWIFLWENKKFCELVKQANSSPSFQAVGNVQDSNLYFSPTEALTWLSGNDQEKTEESVAVWVTEHKTKPELLVNFSPELLPDVPLSLQMGGPYFFWPMTPKDVPCVT